MLKLSPSRGANLLSVFTLVVLITTITLIFRAVTNEADAYGPQAIAVADDHAVFLVAGGVLFHTTAEGQLRGNIPLSTLGLDGPIAHLASFGHEVLITDGVNKSIVRCQPEEWRCSPVVSLSKEEFSGVISLGVSRENNRIYIGSVNKHAIYAFDVNGNKQYRIKVEGGLKFPNDIFPSRDRLLVITDTNHHRVILLEDLGGGSTRLAQELAANNNYGDTSNKWPVRAVRDELGTVWVINANGLLQGRELIRYVDGRAERRISLAENAELEGLALLQDAILVSDSANDAVYNIDINTMQISTFGSEALRQGLVEIKTRREYWHDRYNISLGLIALCCVLLGVALYLDWKAKKLVQDSATVRQPGVVAEPAVVTASMSAEMQMRLRPDALGIRWLKVQPRVIRSLLLVGLLLPLFGISMLVMAFTDSANNGSLPWMLWMFPLGISIIFGIVLFFAVMMFRGMRLGTDGNKLYYVDILGRRGDALPEECVSTGRRILIGKHIIPLGNPRFRLFNEQELSAVIEPVLKRVPETTEWRYYLNQMRNRDWKAWLGTAAIIALIVLRIWLDS